MAGCDQEGHAYPADTTAAGGLSQDTRQKSLLSQVPSLQSFRSGIHKDPLFCRQDPKSGMFIFMQILDPEPVCLISCNN